MWFRVLHVGVPLGSVDLPAKELATGLLVPLGGYAGLASRVRAASCALLEFGFCGPPVSALPDSDRRRARFALLAGATLALELRTLNGDRLVPTRFINLIETPDDGRVVVVARFREVHGPIPAARQPGSLVAGSSLESLQ